MPDSAAPALEVSVVVPHYADLTGLRRCLDALERQTLGRDRFEIVIADNASPNRADVEAAIAGRARLVVVPDRGAGPARNGGVAAATAPVLAFTDADCVPESGWLQAGLAALGRDDVVGGRMLVLVDGARRKTGAEAFEQVFAFRNDDYIRRKGFTVTANLFCARTTFDAVGGFRVAVSEDVDWCRRARAQGFTLGYAADAVVGHPARADWPSLVTKWRRLESEGFQLSAASTRAGRLRWLAKSWLLPASILAHAPRVLRARELRGARERGVALATLARLRLWRWFDAHRLFMGRR